MVDLLLLALLLYAFFKCIQFVADRGSQFLAMDRRKPRTTNRSKAHGRTQGKRGKNEGEKRVRFSKSGTSADSHQGTRRGSRPTKHQGGKATDQKTPRGARLQSDRGKTDSRGKPPTRGTTKRGGKSGQKFQPRKGRDQTQFQPKSQGRDQKPLGKVTPMVLGSPPASPPDPSWTEGKPGLQMTVDMRSNRTVCVDLSKKVTVKSIMTNKQEVGTFVVKPTNPAEQDEETMSGIEEERMFEDLRRNGGAIQSLYIRERPYDPDFPTTLEGFGYQFHGGKLVNIETGGPFVFEAIPGDKDYNQRRYEALGEIITEIVYDLLEKEVGLHRIPVPSDCSRMVSSFVFVSDGALTNREKLMVLVHGSGVVRAGQWSRRLIMNDCLLSGTQLPYIMRALQEGYGVVVLNTNRNSVVVNDTVRIIPGSSTPEWHGCTVWKEYILASPARRIDIVAHSYGGKVTVEMMRMCFEDFRRRVHKIAFTDSVHSLVGLDRVSHRWITGHALNWVSHTTPLDTILHTVGDVPRISAGTTKHEETSCCAINSVFTYFQDPATGIL